MRKEMHHKQQLLKRQQTTGFNFINQQQQRALRITDQADARKYSVFSEESSSLSGDFEMEQSMESTQSSHKNGRFQYPLCLSSIILRLSDILLNPRIMENIKTEHRSEIIRLIQLCLQEQKCLIYKMPFFVLNFLTSSNYTN